MPQAGDSCTTANGRSGYLVATGRGDELECVEGDSALAAQAAHASASAGTAPINTEEPISERIARMKREKQSGESGEGAAQTSGLTESSNKSTTAGSALRDASDPQRAASDTKAAGAGATSLGSAAPGTDRASETAALGQRTTKVADGTKSGERVRSTTTGLIPESNDVMLGDQSTRKDGAKEVPVPLPEAVANLKEDGSTSPHDASSEGGSRQADAHQQLRDAVKTAQEDDTPPAFRAEAKARTI